MDINKFTEKAREAVTQAQSIAVGMGHQDIDSEHLALALIRQEQGIVPRILDQMGVQTAALAVAVEEKLRKRPSVSGGGMDPNRISITQRLAKVLGDAENESRRMKDEYAGRERARHAAGRGLQGIQHQPCQLRPGHGEPARRCAGDQPQPRRHGGGPEQVRP